MPEPSRTTPPVACLRGGGVLIAVVSVVAAVLLSAGAIARATTATDESAAGRLGEADGVLADLAVDAVSRPSDDAQLAFTINGRVAELLVDEGERVSSGQPLITLDDRIARLEREQLAARAASTAQLDAAAAQLALARTDLERVESLLEDGVAGPYEVERQTLAVRQAEARLNVQRESKQLASLQLDAADARLEQYTLRSPIAGVVERVTIDVGETARALEPVLRVVRIDPLRIDASTPTSGTLLLEAGDPAWVRVDVGESEQWLRGEIVSLAAVADAGSNTRRVRIEAANPAGLPAGARVVVWYSEPPSLSGMDADDASPRGSTRESTR